MPDAELILLRHGQSVWNAENRFTGWEDVALSEQGMKDARRAGRLLAGADCFPDAAFTSRLRRAIHTLWLVLDEMDRMWLPQHADWRLNERHYGALQGVNKADAAAAHGEAQVRQWRRGYDTPPPLLENMPPCPDQRYAGVAIPRGESLKDVMPRVQAVWTERVAPLLTAGQRVLITAHGNSLRALIKHLETLNDEDIMGVEIPTAAPIIYQLDATLRPVKKTALPLRA